jgi:hypothetical protein
MNSKLWIQKALSLCLSVAILATYSMVGLAAPGKAAGELTVSGKNVNGESPFVLVNGEAARSGRSVFSGSTITTPETASAVMSLGKFGKIELAPATSLTLTFDEKGIFGDLTSGKVTVLGANDSVDYQDPQRKNLFNSPPGSRQRPRVKPKTMRTTTMMMMVPPGGHGHSSLAEPVLLFCGRHLATAIYSSVAAVPLSALFARACNFPLVASAPGKCF